MPHRVKCARTENFPHRAIEPRPTLLSSLLSPVSLFPTFRHLHYPADLTFSPGNEMAGRIPLPPNDFRASSPLEYHWNDPPQRVFHRHIDSDHPIDVQYIKEVVTGVLAECKQVKSGSAQKRVLDDTERRVKVLVDQLDKGEIDARLMSSLGELCQAIESCDFAKAVSVHTALMTTDFNQHGQWLLGLKRLVDLYQKAVEGGGASGSGSASGSGRSTPTPSLSGNGF